MSPFSAAFEMKGLVCADSGARCCIIQDRLACHRPAVSDYVHDISVLVRETRGEILCSSYAALASLGAEHLVPTGVSTYL